MNLLFKIYWDKNLCDKFATYQCKKDPGKILLSTFRNGINPVELLKQSQFIKRKCDLNAYLVCIFVTILKTSENYRVAVSKHLFKTIHSSESSSVIRIRLRLLYPRKHIIDYRWSDILNDLCQERRELDSALAWLSTLGGAFSALGDNFEHCAVMAGRISISQFRIALKLGDPQTISRCRLFYAVSLIQRSDLKLARYIIEDEYHKAVTIHLEDKRLKRMCCGIWAKLRYEWRKKYKRKF